MLCTRATSTFCQQQHNLTLSVLSLFYRRCVDMRVKLFIKSTENWDGQRMQHLSGFNWTIFSELDEPWQYFPIFPIDGKVSVEWISRHYQEFLSFLEQYLMFGLFTNPLAFPGYTLCFECEMSSTDCVFKYLVPSW